MPQCLPFFVTFFVPPVSFDWEAGQFLGAFDSHTGRADAQMSNRQQTSSFHTFLFRFECAAEVVCLYVYVSLICDFGPNPVATNSRV